MGAKKTNNKLNQDCFFKTINNTNNNTFTILKGILLVNLK